MSRVPSDTHAAPLTDEPPTALIPAALRASTGFLLARVGGASRKSFVQTLTAWDIRLSHYGALMALADGGVVSQQQLGQIIGVDPRNVVAIVDLLEGRGFVARAPDPRDRRRYAVTLTATGRTVLHAMREAGEAQERHLLAALTDAERATLHELLLKLL